jgi:hypothetical protein
VGLKTQPSPSIASVSPSVSRNCSQKRAARKSDAPPGVGEATSTSPSSPFGEDDEKISHENNGAKHERSSFGEPGLSGEQAAQIVEQREAREQKKTDKETPLCYCRRRCRLRPLDGVNLSPRQSHEICTITHSYEPSGAASGATGAC